MQINLSVNLEKRHLIFVVILVCVLFVVGVSAFTNPATNTGHDASEVGPGTFGGEADSVHAFPGNLNVNNNLFFPTNLKGIFWAPSYDVTKPHIDYSPTTGLFISTGTTGKDVNVETTGKLYSEKIGSQNITANNITSTNTITLGGVARNTWPSGVYYPQDCPSTYVVNGITSAGAIKCAWPLVPSSSCPAGQFMNGITPTGVPACAAVARPITCTTSLYDCVDVPKACDAWSNCPGDRVVWKVRVKNNDPACTGSSDDTLTLRCCRVSVTCTAS